MFYCLSCPFIKLVFSKVSISTDNQPHNFFTFPPIPLFPLLHLVSNCIIKMNYEKMLEIAIEEAKKGSAEGGIPIGAALFDKNGILLGKGRNRRVQENDASVHGETDAFRKAGRQKSYRDTIMVTTLAPCWYCSGLVRQFKIGTVVVGESKTFQGGIEWLKENGVKVIDLDSQECVEMLGKFINQYPLIWNEDIGED